MAETRSHYADRIASLAAEARAARDRFDPDSLRNDGRDGSADADGTSEHTDGTSEHTDGTSEHTDGTSEHTDGDSRRGRAELAGTAVSDSAEAALVAARDGLGPVVGVYVEARTEDEPVRFSQRELDRLHAATSDWLAVYAQCRGSDADPNATVREAAELLIDTHDITDVAALLTGLHRDDR